MEITAHVESMRLETERLVERLRTASLATQVATCPGWTLHDLAVHTATAHRWATAVIERRAQHRDDVRPPDVVGDVPADAALGPWLVAGQERLASVIAATPPDADFWRFIRDAPSSLAFWARRQAHETTIHRVDADLAAGVVPLAPSSAFAADGVDELVCGFAPRYRPTGIPAARIGLHATDTDRHWTVSLADGAVAAEPADGACDLRISAPAAALYLLLWNRGDADTTTLEGDAAALGIWRRAIAV